MHGKGRIAYSNGNVYDGHWHEGEFHGQGTYTRADGSSYDGAWRAGKRHGIGYTVNMEGKRTKAIWSNGKKDRDIVIGSFEKPTTRAEVAPTEEAKAVTATTEVADEPRELVKKPK
mmetsp:Transcript_28009/g.37396  ORF Transcript_28009/g.37396 Transcript_28009/m.37396 type:complete len:116 (-) Transcript_28009:863-1210(-)